MAHMSAEMERCIKNCESCHHTCIETMTYCLGMGGKHSKPEHIRLLQDCIEMCQTSADFMLRGSPLHSRTCGVCAEVCERCAQDCERIDSKDEQMKECADICRRCCETCRRMSGVMVA